MRVVTHHSVHGTDTYCKLAVSIQYRGAGAAVNSGSCGSWWFLEIKVVKLKSSSSEA